MIQFILCYEALEPTLKNISSPKPNRYIKCYLHE